MSENVLSFVVFLLYQLSEAWNMPVPQVYSRLKTLGILDGYIISFYDVLHTLGQEYLIDDITEIVREREAKAQ